MQTSAYYVLLTLALVGCSRTRVVADTTPLVDAGAAPASAVLSARPIASAAVDAGPKGPTIELRMPGKDAHSWSLEATGLPAISADGTQILFVIESDPDQRGYPNDAFDVRRVSDDLNAQSLKGFDGYELGSSDDNALRPAIEKRATVLHALLAREAWTPMKAATSVATNTFSLDDLRFTLNGGQALLTKKGAQLGAWDTSTWRRPDILPDSMSSSTCVFTPELVRVHIDEKSKVIAATVRQRVKDMEHANGCLGPDDTHALHW